MTGQIAYDVHTARIDDFHRRAAEQRRAASSKPERRRAGRFVALIGARRSASLRHGPARPDAGAA